MKKWILSLALATCVSAAYAEIESLEKHQMRSFSAVETDYVAPETVETKYLKVVGMKVSGFSGSHLTKMNTAFEVLEKVVNSEEFKDRVINFKNTKGERAFASNNGLTNEQIYEQFMEGRETLQPNTPGEMNFYLKLYNNFFSRVIGYTSAEINTININKKFFKNYRPSDVAGNLAHEWTHKMGYDHKSAQEHDSAPYAIGYIVDELGLKYLKKGLDLH
jgi:hypothetical protein